MSQATYLISGIYSIILFVWHSSRASKCAHCLGVHLLTHFDLFLRRNPPSTLFLTFSMTFKSSQKRHSNKPTLELNDLRVREQSINFPKFDS